MTLKKKKDMFLMRGAFLTFEKSRDVPDGESLFESKKRGRKNCK